MLKIRLTRIGKKHEPHYRIVVIPARTKREGKAIENIGYYNPRSKDLKLKVERAKYWLSVGAQPTDTARSFLAKHKLIVPLPKPDRPPRKPKKELKKEKQEKAEGQKPDKSTQEKSKKQEAKKQEQKPATKKEEPTKTPGKLATQKKGKAKQEKPKGQKAKDTK